MAEPDLTERLAAVLAERCGVKTTDAVLVGVSGGADSVALLGLLRALNARPPWQLRLRAAHLNHQLRGPDATADADFVAELCNHYDIPCTSESADVAARARRDNVSIEQAGRACRFELFQRLCTRHQLACVALGHHADDQAETVLHRIVRGTALRGLGGMRYSRPLSPASTARIVRPLLAFTRDELRDWLAARGITFRQDSSNHVPDYTRNRIRHELLPLLRSHLNPQADAALQRLADQAQDVYAYLADQAEQCRQSTVARSGPNGAELDRLALIRWPAVVQTEAFRLVLAAMEMPQRDLSYAHLRRVAELAAGSEGTQTLHLPAGFRVRRTYDRLVFERVSHNNSPDSARRADWRTQVASTGCTRLNRANLEITTERIERAEIDPQDVPAWALPASASPLPKPGEHHAQQNQELLDADAVRGPLFARPPRPGDRFDPLGMTGTKKLSDFLIDAKVPPGQRSRLVVLCDRDGPVWLVGYRIAHRVRVTPNTRNVLRIQVRPVDRANESPS
jgi:tRNA(Ile)-lysidine synthase